MSLRATVQNLQKRDEQLKMVGGDLPGFIRAWQSDVVEVFKTIRMSLDQYVCEGLASIEHRDITVIEESLGEYSSERLIITIVGRIIFVEPIARITVGGEGRIDLYRDDRSSERDRVFIVRGQDSSDIWMIEDKKSEGVRLPSDRSFVSRGYRNYTLMTNESIQDAIDCILNMR